MTSRTIVGGLLVVAVAGEARLGAQVPVQAAPRVESQKPPSLPVPEDTRRQIESFEGILRGAIETAAKKLNTRLSEAIPNAQFQLAFQAQPLVTGVVMPDDNAVFHVLIPAIEQTGVKILNAFAMRTPPPGAGTRVASTAGGGLVVDPDPAGPPPMFDPNAEYTTLARVALLDAVLDHGMSIQLSADKTLTIIAGELLPPNSQFMQRSRSLILQISGADLLALRQNRLSRDDAKARIKEFRY